ncbi:hypothetical protein BDW59DRAFT_116047 [Aspergillus cavernicola]|uniref:REJ domain-containing protein n=1 Tax=Aspergillus cavernicola TaxID=176166 RepID=A0ABR4IWL3_9EURO
MAHFASLSLPPLSISIFLSLSLSHSLLSLFSLFSLHPHYHSLFLFCSPFLFIYIFFIILNPFLNFSLFSFSILQSSHSFLSLISSCRRTLYLPSSSGFSTSSIF